MLKKTKNKKALSPYIEMSLILILIFLSIFLGYYTHKIYGDLELSNNLGVEISEYKQCSDLNLRETSKCLRNYVSTFYNYTIRSDEIRTIEDIKQNGGDCYDYNRLYERLANQLGFDSYSFQIKVGDIYHRIAIITDETEYCLLDQLAKINCINLKK